MANATKVPTTSAAPGSADSRLSRPELPVSPRVSSTRASGRRSADDWMRLPSACTSDRPSDAKIVNGRVSCCPAGARAMR